MARVESPQRTGSVPGLVDNPWKQQQQQVRFDPLDRDASFDVVVVGAGVVGLTAALALAKAGGCPSRGTCRTCSTLATVPLVEHAVPILCQCCS